MLARRLKRLLKNTIFPGLCVAALGGCSWLQDWTGGPQSYQTEPQVRVVQTADSTWVAPHSQTSPVTRMVPAQSDANRNAMDRMDALEEQVALIRNDMKMMMPALTKLITMQEAMNAVQPAAGNVPRQNPLQQSSQQPRPFNYSVAEPPPVAASQGAPMPIAYNAPSTSPVPAATTLVRQVRFGEHSNKTRIVLDTSNEVAFRYDLDNSEQLLMIELPTAGWRGAPGSQIKNSPLVASYNAVPDGKGGTNVAIQLRKPVQIIWAQTIPAVSGSKGPRIVIDLAAL